MGHLALPWTLEKRQLRIPGLRRVHSHAWSSVWEEGCSSQPERYPGDCLSMNRLLYGECRGQSNLEGMWASTSLFFFFLSLSQTKSASPTVFFQEAMQHQVPALQKQEQEGVEPLLSQECHPSWHAVPTQGCRATPIPHKQAAPRWMLSRQTLCLNIISITKETDSRLISNFLTVYKETGKAQFAPAGVGAGCGRQRCI